jgi:hypothetical protein
MGKVNKLNSIIKRVNNNVRRRQRVLSKLKSMRNKISKSNKNYNRYKQNKNTRIPKLSRKKRNELCFKISRSKKNNANNLLRKKRSNVSKQKREIRQIVNNIKESIMMDNRQMNINDPIMNDEPVIMDINDPIIMNDEQVNMNNNEQQVNINIDQQINLVESNRLIQNCVILNVHGEKIEIPNEYPGDLWVHNNLEFDRDKPLEYFDAEHLYNTYKYYKNICYGIN